MKTIMQHPEIDFYSSATSTSAMATTTLEDLIAAIQSDEFANKIAKLRSTLAAGDDDGYAVAKKDLQAVSISGTCEGRRAKAIEEGRFSHSGFLQLDFDAADNVGWEVEEIVEILKAEPRIVAAFVSPSGAGVKGIARIPICTTKEQHVAAFVAARNHFRSHNLTIDEACKDPVRLMFVSHDPGAWLDLSRTAVFEPLAGTPELPKAAKDTKKKGMLIKGGRSFTEITPDIAREMLAVIPSRPTYEQWIKIASAVWDAIGESEGTAALCDWSPEEQPGEYASKYQNRLTDVHAATLVMLAKEHGWSPPAPVSMTSSPRKNAATPRTVEEAEEDPTCIPEHVFPVPAGEIGHDLAARHIFAVIGPTNRLFMRGTMVHEVAADDTDAFAMVPVAAKRLVSLIETFGAKVMRREAREDGTMRWRSATFPASSADVALSSDGAREYLPRIRQMVSSPVLIPDGDRGTAVIGKGYHPHAGGTFVTGGDEVQTVVLNEAIEILSDALVDFDFPDGGDASRAMASLISPAMKMGGWIDDDFPLDLAEADQSQSGKSFRFKMIHAIYCEHPSAITQAAGGVGSLDERVSRALITGRPFISFDNFRGRMDSQIMETAIRGLGKVAARALRAEADIDVTPFLWQLSTNGAELTRDLANRAVITRIRKRSDNHYFKTYPEGDIVSHIKAHQPKYLGAVHAVIREWASQDRPLTTERRHDFRRWCQSMDWIVQNIFGLPPLLDGHREEQMRTANPRLQWLRDIARAIINAGYDGQPLTAADFGEASEDHDLPLPGAKTFSESIDMRVGRLLGKLFKDQEGDTISVDGMRITRVISHDYDPVRKEHRERKQYLIFTSEHHLNSVQNEEKNPVLL
jgi:hypothetical protein